MALLALTLALLAMTVATTVIEEKPLDMAPDSFDDQYQGCGPDMDGALPALSHAEFQKNPLFAHVWPKAEAEWQRQVDRESCLSRDQAVAMITYTMDDLHKEFNDQVRVAGCSHQEYQDNFQFKTLHFLLTDALTTLRDTQEQQCHCVLCGVDKYKFKANVGDIVRFGQFVSSTLCESDIHDFGNTTMFKVQTCHGAYIEEFCRYPYKDVVLIPPFEKFNVTKLTEGKENVWIELDSIGTFSKYNCEWLRGGSVPRGPCHIGELLLATTALAVTTGIL
ncbi:erythroblast NAD(P)(+)--arginine ADP-ribosyltransferase-like [Catharus ustulatus]|uniref:erythroblast NAD(P)(+)--arginine ADP-ribosyltransferase-like n=1 Tax=Catharus ustulatus TaxID=91951 RepID=UPI001C5AEBD0|nr:erythroblast NAD(P)(+)--arginine ADP-ribosyltransferase-like [Catharus ustulatus]